MKQIPLVTLTTDFGTADGYVASMKGVILNIAPTARLVDITHQIAPQNVRQTTCARYTACPFLPPHTVNLSEPVETVVELTNPRYQRTEDN